MAITQAMTTSFKVEMLQGVHNFTLGSGGGSANTGATFKIALYTSSASLGAATTAFTATNEAAGTGYVSGGKNLTNVTPSNPSGTTAITDFGDITWSTSTITARGAMIYNSTQSNKSVAILDFGSDKSSSSGDFTVQFPTPDATNAIIRIV